MVSIKAWSKRGFSIIKWYSVHECFGVWTLVKAKSFHICLDLIAAVSLDAFDCRIDPFDNLIHKLRPHKGQIKTANNVREIFKREVIFLKEKISMSRIHIPLDVFLKFMVLQKMLFLMLNLFLILKLIQ